jgi:hypothetical protein
MCLLIFQTLPPNIVSRNISMNVPTTGLTATETTTQPQSTTKFDSSNSRNFRSCSEISTSSRFHLFNQLDTFPPRQGTEPAITSTDPEKIDPNLLEQSVRRLQSQSTDDQGLRSTLASAEFGNEKECWHKLGFRDVSFTDVWVS